jgi:predicted lipoprotein with Yx(FWY)xxD motif
MFPALIVALALLADACGTQATPAAPPSTQAPAASNPSQPAHVADGKNGQFSAFLLDDKGMTFDLYTNDPPNTSTCYGKCATAWSPLLTGGPAVAGNGVDAGKLCTTTRTDGTTQGTYNGWPLYYSPEDKQSGDTTGENVGNVWYVVSPAGAALK